MLGELTGEVLLLTVQRDGWLDVLGSRHGDSIQRLGLASSHMNLIGPLSARSVAAAPGST